MMFYALTSAGSRRRCWNPSLKGEVFNTSRGTQQMLLYQKSMFDRYYCIKPFSFARKLWRNCFKKFFLSEPIMSRKSTLPANVLKMPLPGQRQRLAPVLFTDDDVIFYDGPGRLIHKTLKPCINSTWTALLIHGFVLIKTWLLIAYDTAFYAK